MALNHLGDPDGLAEAVDAVMEEDDAPRRGDYTCWREDQDPSVATSL